MSEYFGLFKNWKDVQDNFEIQDEEPDEVLFAEYGSECYSAAAAVIFRNGEKYYISEASHCSCYGLEGSWSPEEYDSIDTFLKVLEMKEAYSDEVENFNDFKKHFLAKNKKGEINL